MNESTITGNTFRTTDYSAFKTLEGNRKVLDRRVGKIINSIKSNGYIFNPIIVNEKMEVIDGQGRLEALRRLGLSVDYVICEGATRNECIALNAYSTVWTLRDYIDSFCADGNHDYIRFRNTLDAFPKINDQVKMQIILGKVYIPQDAIRLGRLKFPEEQEENGVSDLKFCEDLNIAPQRFKGTKGYYYYAAVFARHVGADENRLFQVFDKNALPPAPDLRTALDVISDFYNKSLKDPAKRMYFYPLYEQTMTDKYGWYESKYLSK